MEKTMEKTLEATKQRGPLAKVFAVLSNILFVLLIIGIVFMAYNIRVSRTGMLGPSVMGLRTFQAISASMSPTITVGGLILVKEEPVNEIAVGDILTFTASGSDSTVVTHRVVDVQEVDGEKQFITRGDANSSDDPTPVTEDRVLGTVLVWFNGYDRLATPQGIAILVALAVLILYVLPAAIRKLRNME